MKTKTTKRAPKAASAVTKASSEARGKAMTALLRGINVGGHKMIPMAELRELSAGLGLRGVETYIQSGNMVFMSELAASAAESALEEAITSRFGFSVDVIVRDAEQWRRYSERSPFADAEEARPNHLMLGLSKRPLRSGAEEEIRARATSGERVQVVGDAIWIDFAMGNVARTKLTPTALDRAAGSPVTMRNWRTVLKLAEMMASCTNEACD